MSLDEIQAGFVLLDEAMLVAVSGKLCTAYTGVIYCGVIDCCQQYYALDRAREWTDALSKWVKEQPRQAVGGALYQRAEIHRLQGGQHCWGRLVCLL